MQTIRTAEQYDEFMERVMVEQQPCKYGHIACSDMYMGQCCDELYANLPVKEREDLQ